MIIRDLYDDAMEVLGYCQESVLFSRLTDAIEVLANKGQWDPLQAYADIRVDAGRIVTLPREIEAPIRVKINGTPSFSRSRLFEFSMNALSDDMPPVNWAWEDQGTTPVNVQPATPSRIRALGTGTDVGKLVRLQGWSATGERYQDTITIGGGLSGNAYAKIDVVTKDTTSMPVSLWTEGADAVATYSGVETNPEYRQIRLTKSAAVIRMLFRRTTYKVTSLDDYVPLHSKMAVVLMLKALEAYRRADPAAEALEAAAIKFITEEQSSRNIAHELAAAADEDTPTGTAYTNSDSIVVADIYDEAALIFGPVGKLKLFDKITESVEALANMAQWDGLIGFVDIATEESVLVTMPRYVETPLAINIGGRPAMPRNEFFEFHLNGPGSECQAACQHWDIMGRVITHREPLFGHQLYASSDHGSDAGRKLRIYGFDDEGLPLRTAHEGGWSNGVDITIGDSDTVEPVVSTPLIGWVTRIVKDATVGFVSLYSFVQAIGEEEAYGYKCALYYPDETEPNYIRLKLPSPCTWVRMRYRKRGLKISSMFEPIHLRSKQAVCNMMRAIKAQNAGDLATAEPYEALATRQLSQEQSSHNPVATFSFQFDTKIHMADPMQGIR